MGESNDTYSYESSIKIKNSPCYNKVKFVSLKFIIKGE